MRHFRKQNAGFTLIEVLVALVIVGIVGIAMSKLLITNQKVYLDQDEVVAMQQNLRSGFDIMVQEIRMAGFSGDADTGAGIVATGTDGDSIVFTMDLDEDGALETIAYARPVGVNNLERNGAAIAEGITALGFAYAIDADGDDDGDLDTDGGNTIWAVPSGGNWFDLDTNDDGFITVADDTDSSGTIDGNDTGIAVDVADIRAVRVWLLAETDHGSQSFKESSSFVVGEKVISPGDNKRHRLLTTTIKCRNLGI